MKTIIVGVWREIKYYFFPHSTFLQYLIDLFKELLELLSVLFFVAIILYLFGFPSFNIDYQPLEVFFIGLPLIGGYFYLSYKIVSFMPKPIAYVIGLVTIYLLVILFTKP